MPFSRPTLSELRQQAAADVATDLPGGDALLRFSNLWVLSQVLAGMAYGHYGYIDWIAKQCTPFKATDEYLEAWAGLKNVLRRVATGAAGVLPLTGTVGTDIPAGTPVVRGDGWTYATTADAVIGGGGTVSLAIAATDPAWYGADGNADVGVVLTLGTVIPGVQSSGTLAAALIDGSDTENDDSLRSRMLQEYAAPPQGGDQTDYIEWAEAVPGVTRAFVKPLGMGVGTVVVYPLLDVAESSHNGFPQGSDGVATGETRASAATGDQLTVANYIYPLQPVTALVYVVSPTANTVNFTINGISGASTDTKNDIAAAIAGIFQRYGGPGGTLDGNRLLQGTLPLSLIEAAIAAIPGTTNFVIISPAANIVSSTGAVPVLGTMTYT